MMSVFHIMDETLPATPHEPAAMIYLPPKTTAKMIHTLLASWIPCLQFRHLSLSLDSNAKDNIIQI